MTCGATWKLLWCSGSLHDITWGYSHPWHLLSSLAKEGWLMRGHRAELGRGGRERTEKGEHWHLNLDLPVSAGPQDLLNRLASTTFKLGPDRRGSIGWSIVLYAHCGLNSQSGHTPRLRVGAPVEALISIGGN